VSFAYINTAKLFYWAQKVPSFGVGDCSSIDRGGAANKSTDIQ